ncbi:MAG: YibE/F family protein [Bacillota bacterium]
MRNFILLFALAILLAVPLPLDAAGTEQDQVEHNVLVRAKVLKVVKEVQPPQGDFHFAGAQQVTVEISEGPLKGKILQVENYLSGISALDIDYFPGDRVILSLDLENGQVTAAYLADLARDSQLLYLTAFFVLLLLAIGGFKGLKAVITLGITAMGVLYVLIPGLLKGHDPVWLSILVAAGVTIITLLVVGGVNQKSIAAILGTVGGTLMAGICAKLAISAGRLSGLGLEEAQMLQYIPQEIIFNYQGLLFAAMIIGAIGAIMDVGMSIASAIQEIYLANPKQSLWDLYKSGLNVGRDIIGTMSNTLILAYTGSTLPLLLLIAAHDQPLIKIINLDMIASEVVRALAGSIGLILAVPITAACASLLVRRQKKARTSQGDFWSG